MSKLEYVREIFAFNEWANNRILDVAANVPEEQLRAKPDGQYTSVMTDLAHIIDGQVTWLGRWKTGRLPEDAPDFDNMDSLTEIRAEADKSHRELRDYLASLTDADLDAEAAYALWIDPDASPEEQAEIRSRYADPQVWPRWKMFHHLANHSSFHRGEIAMCLTTLGHSPGELDFLHYQRFMR